MVVESPFAGIIEGALQEKKQTHQQLKTCYRSLSKGIKLNFIYGCVLDESNVLNEF